MHFLRGTAYGVGDVYATLGRSIPEYVPEVAWAADWDESLIGYVYQIHAMAERTKLQSRVQQPNKQTHRHDVIAFTQLYTPNWVIDYLLDSVKGGGPGGPPARRGTVLDPACGSGHFLIRALDKKFERRTAGGECNDDAMVHSLREIAGCDIDSTGLFITRLSLTIKALQHISLDEVPPLNIHDVSSDVLGSLSRSSFSESTHPLSQRWEAVVGNPPYIGRKLLNRELKDQLKVVTPEAHHDLSAAFVSRGLDLLRPGGKLAFITQTSLLYLPSYERLRKRILSEFYIDTVVELGPHVFPLVSGEKVNSMLLVVSAPDGGPTRKLSRFVNLADVQDKENALAEAYFTTRDQSEFLSQPKCTINYATPPSLTILTSSNAKLADYADIRQGLATTDNARFVRWWWQVPSEEIGTKWFPYVKGSGSERWFAPVETVVDWADSGAAIKQAVAESYPYLNGKTEWVVKNEGYYFRPGLTFSFVNAKNLAVRVLPTGCIFDVGGSALFLPDDDEEERLFLLAYLNSSFIASVAQHINPTINFQVGDLKRLPYLSFSNSDKNALAKLARRCVELKRSICSLRETTWRTVDDIPDLLTADSPDAMLYAAGEQQEMLRRLEGTIDDTIIVNISDEHLRILARDTAASRPIPKDTVTPAALAHKLMYAEALRCAHSDAAFSLNSSHAKFIEQTTKLSVQDFATKKFIPEHTRRHHNAPRLTMRIFGDQLFFSLCKPTHLALSGESTIPE